MGVSIKTELATVNEKLSRRKEVNTDSPPHQSQCIVASNWSSVPGTGVTRVASANEVIFLLTFAFAMATMTNPMPDGRITTHDMVCEKSERLRCARVSRGCRLIEIFYILSANHACSLYLPLLFHQSQLFV